MFVTTRTVQTLPGQQLAFVDAWISAAAQAPGRRHRPRPCRPLHLKDAV